MVNYDTISPFYDQLKRIVFSGRLDQAESFYLGRIKPKEKVLIVGGGSGVNLNLIDQNAELTFVELSKKMIEKASLRRSTNITFVQLDFLQFQPRLSYDWIICAFFLDVFDQKKLDIVIEKLDSFATKHTQLLVTDFQPEQRWHKAFASVMYGFFKLTTNMKPMQLLDIHQYLIRSSFRMREETFFMSRFIFSRIYSFEGNLD